MRSKILLLVSLLVVDSSQRCTNPQGENGDKETEGCLQRICKAGVWRTSLANTICCYERTAYTMNTTISSRMSEDGCVKAAIDCVEETPGIAKTILRVENFCKNYATKEQMEEIKKILVSQIEGKGPGCQGEIEGYEDEAEKEEEEEAPQCSQPYTTLSDDWRQWCVRGQCTSEGRFCDYKHKGSSKYGQWTEFKAGWYTFSFPYSPYATLNYIPSGKCGTWAMSWSGDTLPKVGDPVKDITINFTEHTPFDHSITGKVVACRVADTNSVRYLYYLQDIPGDYCGAYCANTSSTERNV